MTSSARTWRSPGGSAASSAKGWTGCCRSSRATTEAEANAVRAELTAALAETEAARTEANAVEAETDEIRVEADAGRSEMDAIRAEADAARAQATAVAGRGRRARRPARANGGTRRECGGRPPAGRDAGGGGPRAREGGGGLLGEAEALLVEAEAEFDAPATPIRPRPPSRRGGPVADPEAPATACERRERLRGEPSTDDQGRGGHPVRRLVQESAGRTGRKVSVYAEPVVVLAPHGVIETIVSDLLERSVQRTSENAHRRACRARAGRGAALGRARPAARGRCARRRDPPTRRRSGRGGQPWSRIQEVARSCGCSCRARRRPTSPSRPDLYVTICTRLPRGDFSTWIRAGSRTASSGTWA